MEHIVDYLAAINPIWVYCIATAIAYIENIFPPSPSDVILVAAGSLAGLGKVDFILLLFLSTIGSTAGFLTIYRIGDWFGIRILETRKLKFIPLEKIHKVENWFKIYGYWVVIANRFLAGTRAIVSFFAGMSELSLVKTTVLSFFSSFLWNFILLFAGRELGKNWKIISVYLTAYGEFVIFILITAVLAYVTWQLYKKHANTNPAK